jgi:sodium/hydrogen exchanger 8
LNDAVALVLFKTFSSFMVEDIYDSHSLLRLSGKLAFEFSYNAICSPALGILFAWATALVFKLSDFRQFKMLELSLYILMMYIPFILADTIHLSGIVAIFFCGMSARRYIEPNLSEDTKRSAEVIFKLTAYLAETCIFLELGLSVFGLSGSFNWAFIAWALAAALLGRAISIYPISMLYNWSLKESRDDEVDSYTSFSSLSTSSWSRLETPLHRADKKITTNMMHVLWVAGLRGAVAYACARKFPDIFGHNDEFVAATMVIVLVTVTLMGGATEPLLQHLQIEMNVDEEAYMKEWHVHRKLKGVFHRLGAYVVFYCFALGVYVSIFHNRRSPLTFSYYCRIQLHL